MEVDDRFALIDSDGHKRFLSITSNKREPGKRGYSFGPEKGKTRISADIKEAVHAVLQGELVHTTALEGPQAYQRNLLGLGRLECHQFTIARELEYLVTGSRFRHMMVKPTRTPISEGSVESSDIEDANCVFHANRTAIPR